MIAAARKRLFRFCQWVCSYDGSSFQNNWSRYLARKTKTQKSKNKYIFHLVESFIISCCFSYLTAAYSWSNEYFTSFSSNWVKKTTKVSRRQYVIALSFSSSFDPVTQRRIAIVHTILLQWALKITFQIVERLFSFYRGIFSCFLTGDADWLPGDILCTNRDYRDTASSPPQHPTPTIGSATVA